MGDLRALALTVLATVTGIDVTSTGATPLYTVPTGKVCIPVQAIAVCTAFTVGSKSTQPVISFGFTGAGFDDWINSETVTGMTQGDYYQFADVNAPHAIGAAGEALNVIVETASDADVETYTVYLLGILADA